MSEYTLELRELVDNNFNLGLTAYPIFLDSYRTTLNQKIIDHYLYHDIGFETPARFKHYLNISMNEIMPYYNKLYQSELLAINPLLSFQRSNTSNKDVHNSASKSVDNTAISNGGSNLTTNNTENQNTTLNSTKTNTGNNVIDDKNVSSDTPKGLLQANDIDSNLFASNAVLGRNTSVIDETEGLETTDITLKTDVNTVVGVLNSTNTMTETGTESNVITELNTITENGFEIPLTELLLKYRETFLNIDMLVIGQLKDLFMMIY